MRTGGARLVAAGILLSRVFGLVRQRAMAHFLGNGAVADALAAAFRIPNLLQNLFGEGSLSASFIPVYAKLLAEGKEEEAGRVAGAVLGLLALLVALVVALGVIFAPALVTVLAPGFSGDERLLTVLLVRVIFPGLGVLVLSAWCLGVLNAHRRFFLSYASPVLWNLAIIIALLWKGPRMEMAALAVTVAWASVVGSVLQLVMQLPTVWRVDRALSLRVGASALHVRTVVRNFAPAMATRGVVQLSGYVDTIIASLLGAGALATLSYAQAISMLPVSVFGMSIAAAELPTMSGATGDDAAVQGALRLRLQSGLQRIAYFVIPSAVAFFALGGVLASALYEGGAFTRDDAKWVWGALMGSSVGLLGATMGRLYASASFALGDTATPFRFAVARVALAAVLGASCATGLPRLLQVDARWGIAALTAASGVAGWIEFALLRRHVRERIGAVTLPAGLVQRIWVCAFIAAAVAVLIARAVLELHPVLAGGIVCSAYGAVYLALTRWTGVDRARRA